MKFRLPSRMAALFGETLLAVVWSLAPLVGGIGFLWTNLWTAGAILVALGLLGTILSLYPTRVTVGADGLTIHWLGRSRFFSYDKIAALGPHVKYKRVGTLRPQDVMVSSGVLMRHTAGNTTYLVCSERTARDLTALVNEKLRSHQRGAATDLPMLVRGDRTVADWIANLRGLLSITSPGYRGNAVTSDALWSVVENPKSEPDERAAAAIALRAHLGEEARPRLRVAIDECASPKLRVALEAIEVEDEATTGQQLLRLARK